MFNDYDQPIPPRPRPPISSLDENAPQALASGFSKPKPPQAPVPGFPKPKPPQATVPGFPRPMPPQAIASGLPNPKTPTEPNPSGTTHLGKTFGYVIEQNIDHHIEGAAAGLKIAESEWNKILFEKGGNVFEAAKALDSYLKEVLRADRKVVNSSPPDAVPDSYWNDRYWLINKVNAFATISAWVSSWLQRYYKNNVPKMSSH